METKNRFYRADRPDRFKIFGDNRSDRDDHMETRLTFSGTVVFGGDCTCVYIIK